MTYSAYIEAGEANPKVSLLDSDESTVLSTITFAPTTPREGVSFSPMRPTPPQWVPVYENTGETVDNELVRKIKGYRFYEKLVFPILDKTSAGQIAAMLSHPYRIKYYPHSDFARYIIVYISGSSPSYINQTTTLPFYNASIDFTGVYIQDSIPFFYAVQRILTKAGWPGAYTSAEQAYALRLLTKGGTYTDTEWGWGHLPEGSMGNKNYSL